MKLLHTSDWHLGQNFFGKSREEEHRLFLEWLLEIIEKEDVDTLIVAGDIFDTATPPNYALELYYNFLTKLQKSKCENIIITAGNHDSIATLKAPKQLLKALNIHVITSGDESEEELIPIYKDKELQAVVCAVPFLRDYVVRQALSSQSFQEKESALTKGIKEHYKKLHKRAEAVRENKDIPLIATGHLTVLGSTQSDSEREIYIGTTLALDGSFLGENFDYVALGHLHRNQRAGADNVRYSGSPIAMSFSEAKRSKKVNIVSFSGKNLQLKEVDIPCFRELLVLRGDGEHVLKALETIEDKESWVEVELNDVNPLYANQRIRERAKELGITLLAVKIDKEANKSQQEQRHIMSLDEVTPLEVFERRMQEDGIEDEALKKTLVTHFKHIVAEVQKG